MEFAYNNSFQSSIGMALFEALHGRPCRSPTCWWESTDKILLGPDMIRETSENIDLIRRRMKMAQDRQKSYADKRRTDLGLILGTWSLSRCLHYGMLFALGPLEISTKVCRAVSY